MVAGRWGPSTALCQRVVHPVSLSLIHLPCRYALPREGGSGGGIGLTCTARWRCQHTGFRGRGQGGRGSGAGDRGAGAGDPVGVGDRRGMAGFGSVKKRVWARSWGRGVAQELAHCASFQSCHTVPTPYLHNLSPPFIPGPHTSAHFPPSCPHAPPSLPVRSVVLHCRTADAATGGSAGLWGAQGGVRAGGWDLAVGQWTKLGGGVEVERRRGTGLWEEAGDQRTSRGAGRGRGCGESGRSWGWPV